MNISVRLRLSAALTIFLPLLLNAQGDPKQGTAFTGAGPDFSFTIETSGRPGIVIDEGPMREMEQLPGGNQWVYKTKLQTGTSHSFYYLVNGAKFGGRTDIPAYLPESYEQPGVPQGKLSEKMVHASEVYPGMQTNYWIYVPAQYDPKTPAALMAWQDGEGHIQRDGGARTLNVIDNLIAQNKIPVMIQVFISPGAVGDKRMRSIEYDSVDDTYARFLRDEVLAGVEKRYNIRKDAYSRGIAGNSSGGICAFNAAWFHPEMFSRVLSRIGSFTSIQWHPDMLEGGNVYPFKIRKEPKRNIRVWLQDGANDIENEHGSWPLQNLQMANSLKMKGYDFHLSFGIGTHNGAHGNSEAPVALAWLWRDYDASKTGQAFEIDASEKEKPLYRVKIANRHAGDESHPTTAFGEAPELIRMVKSPPSPNALRKALVTQFGETDLEKGTAFFAHGSDFVFAVQSKARPILFLDDEAQGSSFHVGDVYYWLAKLTPGRMHDFYYKAGSRTFGGRTGVPAWPADGLEQPGVPKGKLADKRVHTSKIYPGMQSNYWVYTPAQYDPNTPAALMVWQDGEVNVERSGPSHTLAVIDNLTYQKRIPVIVHVFISPGTVGETKMRSIEYDTVDDTYARFLRREILPEVAKEYNLRPDTYSHAIIGESSGGICGFDAAWFHPEWFSRVVSRIGSFTSIQWHAGVFEGGNVFPFLIRKQPKRNIRVWLQDGANDLENEHGSWPLQNIQMANSLKMRTYDFHLSFGSTTHTRLSGQLEAPDELTWLWRDYDPSKTEQVYEMELGERSQPLFRVQIANRQ